MSYAPYPAYKDSGVPWLGQVPEGWEVSRIDFQCTVKARLGWKGLTASEYVDAGYIFLATPNIKGNEIDYENVNYINEQRYLESPEIMIKPGDVLLAKDGSTLGTINLVRNLPRPATVNSSIAVIRPRTHNVSGPYLYRWMEADIVQSTIQQMKDGQGVPHLFQSDIRKFPLPVPPITEQTAIARFLDDKTAEIDDLIAKKEDLLRLLAEQRNALITNAVTKGLDPAAPMKPSGIDWLGEVPEGWRIVPFKWCCQVQSGQVDPRLNEYKDLPLIGPDHIESGTGRLLPFESAEEQAAISGKYQFLEGEVLYSKIRPELSKVAIAPNTGLCSADMYAIRPAHGLLPDFLFFQMLSRHFHRFAVLESMRVAMPKINREALGMFPVLLPDKGTQQSIVDHLRDEIRKMELAEKKISDAKDYLTEYRTALITNAVTGKIKVA